MLRPGDATGQQFSRHYANNTDWSIIRLVIVARCNWKLCRIYVESSNIGPPFVNPAEFK